MGATRAVYEITPSVDETYPRLLTSQPRNRGIDWNHTWAYLETGSPTSPVSVDLFIKTDRQIDVAWFDSITFAISGRLRTILEPAVTGGGEFVPITVNGEPFWHPRITRILTDALDEDRSVLRRGGDTGNIWALEQPVWIGANIPDPSLFLLAGYGTKPLATDAVVAAYERAGCNGIHFWARGEVQ